MPSDGLDVQELRPFRLEKIIPLITLMSVSVKWRYNIFALRKDTAKCLNMN